eukprot:866412-Amphidinium_carterae.1
MFKLSAMLENRVLGHAPKCRRDICILLGTPNWLCCCQASSLVYNTCQLRTMLAYSETGFHSQVRKYRERERGRQTPNSIEKTVKLWYLQAQCFRQQWSIRGLIRIL